MPMNKDKKFVGASLHPVDAFLNYQPGTVKKPVKEKIRKNFLIDLDLWHDYQCLCGIQGLDFSKVTVKLIEKAVAENRDAIDKVRSLKSE